MGDDNLKISTGANISDVNLTGSKTYGAIANSAGSLFGPLRDNSINDWPMINNNVTKEMLDRELKKRVSSEIKRVILINRATPEQQLKMVMENPDVYDLLIEPSDEATQAYIMKTEL
jgi:hypothetical protein